MATMSSLFDGHVIPPNSGGFSNSSQLYNQMAPSHRSRTPIAAGDADGIMSALRDWTENSQRSPSHVTANIPLEYDQNGYDGHETSNFEIRRISPLERKMTPDLIRINPQNCHKIRDEDQPVINHEPLFLTHYQIQTAPYIENQAASPTESTKSYSVTSPRQSMTSTWQSGASSSQSMSYPHKRVTSPVQSPTSGDAYHFSTYVSHQMPGECHSTFDNHGQFATYKTQDDLFPTASKASQNEGSGTATLTGSASSHELYQKSLSEEFSVYKSCGKIEQETSDGFCISNPTYSDTKTLQDVDFYSKENIRSVSQMLIQDQSCFSPTNQSHRRSTPISSKNDGNSEPEHRFSFSLEDVGLRTFSREDNHSRPAGRNARENELDTSDKMIMSSNASPALNNNRRPVTPHNSFGLSNNAQIQSSLTQNSSSKVSLNDSLLSSPKFRALKQANLSDSAKSSPSLSRKFSPSPCKSSPSLDQESKNSLDSSTLSIATSWSSGVGLPFPRSHSSSFSSQSPSQKFYSGSTENFAARNIATCKWEDISGTRYPLPALNDSSFGRDTPEVYLFSGQTSKNLPSLMKKRGLNSDNLFDHNSDLNSHRSYIHPPLYPLIPRAQRTKGDEDSGRGAALGQGTRSDIHKCCSCSCHANTSESSQRATVSPPFPHLSYDVNNNMALFYGDNSPQNYNKPVSLASIDPVEDAKQDRIGQIGKKSSMMKFENHNDHIPNPCSGTKHEGQLKLDGTARALGHRERSLSFPTTRSENRYKVGDNHLGQRENHQREQASDHQQLREETCEILYAGNDNSSGKPFSLSEWSPHHSSRQPLHSDSSQRGRSTGKIQRAPAFRYSSSSLRTVNGLSASDVADTDIGNHGNSPLKKSNRNRPPIPQRDLSITTSSSWKRSPLQLPPNAALDLPPCATVENVNERRRNTPSGEAVKSGRRSHQDIGSFSEASEDDTGIENMNGVTLYENVTQIDWDKIMNVDQEESSERKLGENDRDGFFKYNGLDEEHGSYVSRKQPSGSRNDQMHWSQMGHHHDTSILKMEHAPGHDFNRCLTLPSTMSKLEKPTDVISLDSDDDKMFPTRSPLKNLHIRNRLDDRSGKDVSNHAKLTDEENPSVDSVVKNTTTTYSVPQELFYESLEKESHHFDWRASAHHPSTTSHYYKRGTCHPPDVIPSVVVIDSSSGREVDGISESIAVEKTSRMEENLEDMTPVHRAPAPSEVKGPMQEWVESSVRQLELTEVDSVQQWLFDIRTNTDCESMCILQGKSIHTSPVNLEMTANTIKDNVLKLRTSSRSLLAKFSELHQKLSDGWWNDLWPLCHVVVQEVETVVKECVSFFVEIPQAISSLQQGLQKECSEFKTFVKGLEDSNSNLVQSESLLTNQLVSLGEQCARFVETVQTKLIQVLVYSVQDSASEFNIMVSVKTVHSLVTDYPSIKQILLREQIANALFQVCLQTSFTVSSLKLMSLQILSKLCQDADGRIEIEKIGGVGYLSQIISSPTSSEALKIETAALVGQLTAPETISEYGQTRIHQHLEVLLKALTELMEQSSDPLVFLVISSAVANLSFMGSVVSEHLARQDAARILVESWRDGKVETLNAKDQLVTIFAIMAENQRCREEIRQSGGISLLVTMLQTQLPQGDIRSEDPNEVNVKLCEQIQQKAAIALARLAKDVTCALEIDACDGIPLVTKICKTSSYRNKSVPVLIACLAALRRLHHALGPSSFQEEDVNKLIRPKMIDSIFTCSSMSEESFV